MIRVTLVGGNGFELNRDGANSCVVGILICGTAIGLNSDLTMFLSDSSSIIISTSPTFDCGFGAFSCWMFIRFVISVSGKAATGPF